jgi:hypothetical protein
MCVCELHDKSQHALQCANLNMDLLHSIEPQHSTMGLCVGVGVYWEGEGVHVSFVLPRLHSINQISLPRLVIVSR